MPASKNHAITSLMRRGSGAGSDRRTRDRALLAVALTCIAGYVDAVGYITLGQVYVANMSGNSVSLGIHLAWTNWPGLWHRLSPILGFSIGMLLSRFLVVWGDRRRVKSMAAIALSVEVILLGTFTFLMPYWPAVLAGAVAMGVQAATLSRFNGVTVYTAFVTGTLIKFADSLAQFCWVVREHLHRSREHQWRRIPRLIRRISEGRDMVWFASVWSVYVGGAVAGTVALEELARISMAIPLAALVCLILIDLRHPAPFEESVMRRSG